MGPQRVERSDKKISFCVVFDKGKEEILEQKSLQRVWRSLGVYPLSLDVCC